MSRWQRPASPSRTDGVDEHGGNAATVSLALPPRIPGQHVGQRLTFDQ